MSACKAPVVQEVEPCLPLAKYWAQQGVGKKVDCVWLEEPESHPKDPVLSCLFILSSILIALIFSFSFPPTTYLKASSGMHEQTGECICG